MKQLFTYLVAILVIFASCKTKEDTAATPAKPHEGPIIEPDMLKPNVDTRFQQKFFEAQSEKAIGNKTKAYQAFEVCLTIEPENPAVHYELARMDVDANNLNGALVHLKKSLAADENNAWYHHLAADVYMMQGKYDLAYKEYLQVEKLNPDDQKILYDEANALLYSGKKQEAIKVLNRLEQREGVMEEISMQKHKLYLEMNDLDGAEVELQKLANAFPSEPKFNGMLLQFYQGTGQNEKVKGALEKLSASDPGNGQVHMQLSEYYAMAGDDNRSYQELKAAFATTDISIDQKINVLLKYYNLSEVSPPAMQQAYELLDITEKVNPSEAKIFSMYGDFLNRDAHFEEARMKYRKAIALDPSRSIIWNELMVLDSQLGDFESMKSESEKALEYFPAIPEFYYYNGAANNRLKNYSRAQESLAAGKELVIENTTLLVQFYSMLGEVYNELKQYEKSDESYEQVVKVDPNNAFAMNNYAYYLSLRKAKLDRAAELSKRSLEISPENDSFMDTYAWVLFQQSKFQDALLWIEKAYASAGENADVLEHYGDILFKLGRKTDALEKWKASQSAGGNSPALLKKISDQNLVE